MQAVINIKYDKINMCVITYEYICMYFYIYLHRILKNNYSRILIFLQFFYEHFYLTIVNNSNLQHQSYSCVNISHLKLWRHPIPWNHGLNKLESTLPDDASTQVWAFLAKWVFKIKALLWEQSLVISISDHSSVYPSVQLPVC